MPFPFFFEDRAGSLKKRKRRIFSIFFEKIINVYMFLKGLDRHKYQSSDLGTLANS